MSRIREKKQQQRISYVSNRDSTGWNVAQNNNNKKEASEQNNVNRMNHDTACSVVQKT